MENSKTTYTLEKGGVVDTYTGIIPSEMLTKEVFDIIWNLHPDEFGVFRLMGKDIVLKPATLLNTIVLTWLPQ